MNTIANVSAVVRMPIATVHETISTTSFLRRTKKPVDLFHRVTCKCTEDFFFHLESQADSWSLFKERLLTSRQKGHFSFHVCIQKNSNAFDFPYMVIEGPHNEGRHNETDRCAVSNETHIICKVNGKDFIRHVTKYEQNPTAYWPGYINTFRQHFSEGMVIHWFVVDVFPLVEVRKRKPTLGMIGVETFDKFQAMNALLAPCHVRFRFLSATPEDLVEATFSAIRQVGYSGGSEHLLRKRLGFDPVVQSAALSSGHRTKPLLAKMLMTVSGISVDMGIVISSSFHNSPATLLDRLALCGKEAVMDDIAVLRRTTGSKQAIGHAVAKRIVQVFAEIDGSLAVS